MSDPEDTPVATHRWEEIGLGAVPFRLRCIQELPSPSLLEAGNVAGYNNALAMIDSSFHPGTCAVCGQALMVNYGIESGDGRRFSVGCECVMKRGDVKMITRAKALERQRQRAKAAAKREAAYQARQADRNAELAAQRERNGGRTDDEVERDRRNALRAVRVAELAPIAARLADGRCGFRDSVAADMEDGRVPYGRGRDITVEILAKQAGRSGTEAFVVEADRLIDWFADFDARHAGEPR